MELSTKTGSLAHLEVGNRLILPETQVPRIRELSPILRIRNQASKNEMRSMTLPPAVIHESLDGH